MVLRGLIKRAFPYANLINKEEWESTCVPMIEYAVNSADRIIQTRIHCRSYESYL